LLARASAGAMAAETGSRLRADSSLIEQSIATRQIVCCNNAEQALRPDGTRYGADGIRSMMVMPLFRDSAIAGMFELLSDRTQAFDDEDGAVLERLSEMALTAVEHAEAGERASSEIARAFESECEIGSDQIAPAEAAVTQSEPVKEAAKLDSCEACGFPISEGRKLCLDCEEAQAQGQESGLAPAFLTQLENEKQQGWLQAHFYTIGTVLMVALTVVVLMLKLR
jgi:GAF domain